MLVDNRVWRKDFMCRIRKCDEMWLKMGTGEEWEDYDKWLCLMKSEGSL
jgi:hypothetical protein